MNFYLMMQTIQMTINKSRNILLIACIIAVVITVIELAYIKRRNSPAVNYCCFKTGKGWGYDIRVNKKLFIHQTVIAGFTGAKGFDSEQQAGAAAAIVIEKIKSGQRPSINRDELQQPGILSTP
jgi:hypothetical protein